ncbi:helix-turn-helix domain-containing protein [Nocardia abscessus]|uniref:helix-turn-helix domain-containing protein n=1 Tax=Nocardia abscessus TaxID=120957 RepID=UPI001895779B|nr:helix-turn-helix transcriptional regulator [Nocardia abscessus]MBF6335201.1 helix-turn-helix domain-containing protein [Nocardia abscessus]
MTEDDDGPEDTETTLPRRQLGRLLRDARMRAGLSLEVAARTLGWGNATISRLENGRNKTVRATDLHALGGLYGVDAEDLVAWKELAGQAPVRSWLRAYSDVLEPKFNTYVELESAAGELAIFQPLIIPGLLQTHDYAQAMNRARQPQVSEADLERLAAVRARRQHLLTRPRNPCKLTTVIHENALRTIVGNPQVMADQCRHAADMSTRDNIELRILRQEAGLPTGRLVTPFIVMTFPKDSQGRPVEPSVIYAESYTGDAYLEKREDVQRCRHTFRTLAGATMDARASRTLLRELARSYSSER